MFPMVTTPCIICYEDLLTSHASHGYTESNGNSPRDIFGSNPEEASGSAPLDFAPSAPPPDPPSSEGELSEHPMNNGGCSTDASREIPEIPQDSSEARFSYLASALPIAKPGESESAITPPGVCAARCGHVFHTECIEKWLEVKESNPAERKCCPQCRAELRGEGALIPLFLGIGNKALGEREAGRLTGISHEQVSEYIIAV